MSPSSFPGMQAPASGLDRPHPACASEHVALSPRTPSCASTALGLLRHLQSHDDDPWLVGDALNGRGLVPTSSSPLRSQSHGDNAWPDADLDSLGSLPLSGSWTPNQLRSMSFENLQVGSVSLGSGSVGSPVTSVPQAGSNSRQCDWAALASSDNSLSRAFADLNSVRGDHRTSGCHPGHRRAVNVEQQACRTVLPPLGNCFREAATRSCTVSHTCQGTTGSGDNMRSLAVLARHAAGGSHHSYVGSGGGARGRWRRPKIRLKDPSLRTVGDGKNCHFREHAPKRSPLFACCSPKPATRSVFQCLMRWMARLCGRVLLGTGSSSEWSPHWTPHWGVHSLLLLCCRAEAYVVFCRPSVRIGTCGTWARPHIFLRKGTPMKQTGTALYNARASAAARSRRARGSICTASGTAKGSRPLAPQALRPHDTAC